jgi:nucleotide-binding universal stress UspA family protein
MALAHADPREETVMIEKILLPTDGSEHSEKAVGVASELALATGAEVLVLHVLEGEQTWAVGMILESSQEASELVDGVVRRLKEGDVSARGEIVQAAVARTPRAILDVSKNEGVDLIVMGTRGLSNWERLLVGSVAHKVAHLAEVPVLLVP